MTGRPLPSLDQTLGLVALELGVRRIEVGDRLVEDLGVESIDLVAILAAVEDRWGISMDHADLARARTVEDLHALVLEEGSKAPG